VGVDVFHDPALKPPVLVQKAYEQGAKGGYSVLIVDTAGRSQMDETLMEELKAITRKVTPADTLLVVDSMIGQEALHIAEGFRDTVSLSGLILTKMDGDSRGGAAISIRSVTGVPIKYLGVGEGIEALEAYDPRRLASRILGMGDVIGLIEKAEQAFDLDESKQQAEKMMSGKFTLEDFASQMKQIRKLGPISQIFEMLPGNLGKAAQQVPPQEAEKQLKLTEAIISSMTREERRDPDILNASRRRRIARGSGVEVMEVNRVIKNFREAQKLMKTLQKTGGRGLPRLFG
jgi:signal recognition particle subunit SRP54